MTQAQINCFLTVAAEKNMSRAAENLFVSQPTLSKQLRQLEEELGVVLFRRENHGMEITPAGEAFEKLFTSFKRDFKITQQYYQSMEKNSDITFRFGCLEGWDITRFYTEFYKKIKQEYTNIRFEICGCNMDRMLYGLRNGEIDVAITTDRLFQGYPDIEMKHLQTVDASLIYSEDHPAAERDDLQLIDFKDTPFLISAPPGFKNASTELLEICEAEGFIPTIQYTSTLSEAYMLLQTGEYVMLANTLMMGRRNRSFSSLHLEKYKRNISMAYIRGKDSAVGQIIRNELWDYFKKLDREELIRE